MAITYDEAVTRIDSLRPMNYDEASVRVNRISSVCLITRCRVEIECLKTKPVPTSLLMGDLIELNRWIAKSLLDVYPSIQEDDWFEDWFADLDEEEREYELNNPRLLLYSAGKEIEYERFTELVENPEDVGKEWRLSFFFGLLTYVDVEAEHWTSPIEIFGWPIEPPTASGHWNRERFKEMLEEIGLEHFYLAYQVCTECTGNEALDISDDMILEGSYGDWPPHMDELPWILSEWIAGQPWIEAYDEANQEIQDHPELLATVLAIWESAYDKDTQG